MAVIYTATRFSIYTGQYILNQYTEQQYILINIYTEQYILEV